MVRSPLKTRVEIPADGPAIRAVHLLAFQRAEEADLVERLRDNGAAKLSMVAELEGAVVGHVLFSPVQLGQGATAVQGLGLAPVGVLPHMQKKGIGSQLISDALRNVAAEKCAFVVVLGEPGFYARFGFKPARQFGAHCKWDVPADAFMLLAFDAARVATASGLASYRDEFDSFD
jgi:putative acetyltransferase